MELRNDAPPALRPAAEAGFQAVERELATGFPAGAAAALVDVGGNVASGWGGTAVTSPLIAVAGDTVFDLASLTKQVVTAPLAALLAAEGRVLSRGQLIDALAADADEPILERSIDAYVGRLRSKLGDGVQRPRYIETVRGVGYRVVADA